MNGYAWIGAAMCLFLWAIIFVSIIVACKNAPMVYENEDGSITIVEGDN